MIDTKPSKWGKVGKVSICLSVFILLLFASAYLASGIPSASSSLKKSREDAAKAGLFSSEAEVLAFNHVEESDNSDSILAKLKCPDLGYGDEIPKKVKENWSKVQEALPLLRQACAKKHLVAYRDLVKLSYDSPDSLCYAHQWGLNLIKVAEISAKHGNFDETKQFLELTTDLAMMSDDDHSFAGMWNRFTISARIQDLIRKHIPKHCSDPEWLQLFFDTLKKLDEPYDLASMLKVEHFYVVNVTKQMRKNSRYLDRYFEFDVVAPVEFRLGRFLPRFPEANEARINQYFTTIYPKIPKDPYDWNGADNAYKSVSWMLEDFSWSYAVLKYASGNQLTPVRWLKPIVVHRNGLMQAVKILKDKLDPGKGLPLAGRYRTDLDGLPLRIKRLAQGWVVYSVGSNLIDDGGEDNGTRMNDWVIHLSPGTVPVEKSVKPVVTPGRGAPPLAPKGP